MISKRVVRAALVAGLAVSFLIAIPGIQLAQQPQAVDPRVQQRSYLFKDTNEQIPYGVYVSSKVRNDRKNPLIVALHGLGGDQDSMVRVVRRTVDFVEEGGYILVTPMGYNSGGWYGIPPSEADRTRPATPPASGGTAVSEVQRVRELSEKDVLNVLEMMRKEFNVDERRTYLMGHSMGGAGTLYLGAKYPSIWAAIAAFAPAAGRLSPDSLASIPDMPVIIVQGDMDTAVPVANVRRWADKLKELKMTHEYHEIPGGDHGNVIGIGMPDVFRFFASHPKPVR